MADALIGVTIQIMLQKTLSLATDGIGRAFGFKEELESMKESLAMIRAVVADAEETQGHDQAVNLWLKRLEGVAFDADNVLDELNYEFIRRQLKGKLAPLPLPATSRETDSIVRQNVFGRANDASRMVETLLSSSEKVVSVVPITGMGGLGKTTLAQLVYNDPKIRGHFDKKMWICVSENFEVTRLFKLILESLTKQKVKTQSRDVIAQDIRKELEEKKYLLVLDDIWDERSQL
ncbi:putative disease resistance protein RGA4 [Coffea eugenioides]|uniref:putative disease resistance protein RGA4 n=1 Tax=Coffea eugenioides TaxID=49369 RepID=UPI000F604819|nr:putative disease resistance protein RGA4 [Coffea eugenioides]